MEELETCGRDVPDDEMGQMVFLIDKINVFSQDAMALVQGEEHVEGSNIRLFNRIRKEFHKWSQLITDNFQTGRETMRKEVCKFENHHRGRELPGFVNYKTFENIVKKQIQRLEGPSVDMLHTVTGIIRVAFTNISEKNFNEFFNLLRTCKSKIDDIMLEQEREAEKSIRLHFQMEQTIYCQDHTYREALEKVREDEEEEEGATSHRHLAHSHSSQESSAQEIFQHLAAYYQETGSRISSHVPLIIQFYTLQTFSQQLQRAMLQLLQNKDGYDMLLRERSDTRDRRKCLKAQLARLEQARRRLAKFPA
ncbi:interferon-induced GTP-binding protein Mx1-like [Erinaceus europaeus]|uniref:Interferon-induced GTP-binding protein Mx1 n=1 Tax=Erinaceus europaeus TaxID=9365 RepID=A0ABM3WTN3_ERIEU|nr:interferon-induced GTP-binding protein Mx1-like [Erinaceus europaeus]